MFATLMIASLLWSAPAAVEDTTDPADMLAPNDPDQKDRDLPAPNAPTEPQQTASQTTPANKD